MADTANFGWTKPTVAGDDDAWGGILNTALDDIDTDLNTVQTTADAALPVTGGTMTGLLHVKTESYTVVNLGATLNAVVDVDMADGNYFYGTVTGNITTLTFSNPPASGKFGGFILELTNGGAFTIDWTDENIDWPGGSAPSLTAAGVDFLYFFTRDAGATWHGALIREDSK